MKVGDTVWRRTRVYFTGMAKIVAVVNAGETPQEAARRVRVSLDSRMQRNNAKPRKHESYLVYEDGRILWPRVSSIGLIEEKN